MNSFFYYFVIISFFWFLRQIKTILFWLYLWQLKEYRFDRFLDHFRTEKGKQLLLDKLLILKLILIFFLFLFFFDVVFLPWQKYDVNIFVLSFLIILYFLESIKGFFNFFQKKLKIPVLTQKIVFLILILVLFQFFYLFNSWQSVNFIFLILAFDILTPVIVLGIILFFQPLSVLWKNQIIKKAIKKREEFKNLLVIGITGSYGKTSTKEFLATILAEKFKILKTKEHQNTEIGIAQCILNELDEEDEIFVVEMGAYKKGEIKLLCQIAKPKIGIITGINKQHLALFGSMENLLSAEGGRELIDSLPKDGIIFFNTKNKYCRELYQKTHLKKYLYGETAEIFGQENILGAIAVAKELGLSNEEINRGVEKIKNKLPGIEKKKGINNLIIFDASYSANPDSVIGHLEYLKNFPGKKIIIMPCLIELGKSSKEIHQTIGREIGKVCDLAIITTKDRFKEISKEAIKSKRIKKENILYLENSKKILEKIKTFSQENDIILLEGRVSKEVIKLLLND